MDLETVFLNRADLVAKVQAQGFDLSTLFDLCDPLFALTDQLEMTPLEVAEFVLRIKNAAASLRQAPVTAHALFAKTYTEPVRISIESSVTKKATFFKLLSDHPRGLFKCESCGVEVIRTEAKEHVLRAHDSDS